MPGTGATRGRCDDVARVRTAHRRGEVRLDAASLRRARSCASTEVSCEDGKDDDCDGRIDCADSNCSTNSTCMAGGQCMGYTTICCGQSVSGTTIGGPSRVQVYACSTWYTPGREAFDRVVRPTTGSVTVNLSALTKDLDLLALGAGPGGGCNRYASSCKAASTTTGASIESVTFTAQAGQPYFLVVDGYSSNAGPFSLSVSCP